MKLFKVTADNYDYDEFDEMVVAAHNFEEAVKLCVVQKAKGTVRQIMPSDLDYDPVKDNNSDIKRFIFKGGNQYSSGYHFNSSQSPLSVQEIDINKITKPQHILDSFNAG